jgi:PAS domain S-box-containing protein
LEQQLVEQAAHMASIIIERDRNEAALRESEERFHQIFVQKDDAILLIRLDNFDVIDANPSAEELFVCGRAELLSMRPFDLIEPEDFDALIAAIPQSGPAEVFQLDRAEGIRRDGTRITIAIRCKILLLHKEHVMHCSIRDITEKIQLEENVRTAQAKLIHANKMTSIGMLASSVAHEINNPNNCISVNAEMLVDVWKDAEPLLKTIHAEQGEFMLRGIPFTKMQEFAPRLLDGIREGSRRITAIVQNMKDYVREDKSGYQGSIDINQLLQNAIAILWHHIHIHTDKFTTVLGEGLPPARGNGQQIEQVLINLITNALQALPDKRSGVCVTTGKENGELLITVRDEGMGMDEATLARVTEPFFTTRSEDGGTGLGLYISASIIKEHGGTLEFQSEPGKGTTTIVRLAVAE